MVRIICVGSIKEEFVKEAVRDLLNKCSKKIEIVEVKDEPCSENLSPKEKKEIMRIEGERILQAIEDREYVAVLSPDGKDFQENRFCKIFRHENLCFVIGGSLGVCEEVKRKANEVVSFGSMIYPHQLMRWILLEKIVETKFERCLEQN